MTVRASVNYHIKSDTQQAFLFDVGGKYGQLVSPELISTEVDVTDIRNDISVVNFNTDGITFIKKPSAVKNFTNARNWEEEYDKEIRALLKQAINAREIIVFDHTVRIDETDATRRPARNVHNDYSEQGAEKRLIDLIGEHRAEEFHNGKFGFVNVWRPLEHTIRSSPLGFIKPDSVRSEDWMNIELIYPDRRGQILGVAQSSKHEWFFLSEMTTSEVAIFNIYDNSGRPYLAHSALDLSDKDFTGAPRKSIETRTLVRYE